MDAGSKRRGGCLRVCCRGRRRRAECGRSSSSGSSSSGSGIIDLHWSRRRLVASSSDRRLRIAVRSGGRRIATFAAVASHRRRLALGDRIVGRCCRCSWRRVVAFSFISLRRHQRRGLVKTHALRLFFVAIGLLALDDRRRWRRRLAFTCLGGRLVALLANVGGPLRDVVAIAFLAEIWPLIAQPLQLIDETSAAFFERLFAALKRRLEVDELGGQFLLMRSEN